MPTVGGQPAPQGEARLTSSPWGSREQSAENCDGLALPFLHKELIDLSFLFRPFRPRRQPAVRFRAHHCSQQEGPRCDKNKLERRSWSNVHAGPYDSLRHTHGRAQHKRRQPVILPPDSADDILVPNTHAGKHIYARIPWVHDGEPYGGQSCGGWGYIFIGGRVTLACMSHGETSTPRLLTHKAHGTTPKLEGARTGVGVGDRDRTRRAVSAQRMQGKIQM